jgi:hypothetical protein
MPDKVNGPGPPPPPAPPPWPPPPGAPRPPSSHRLARPDLAAEFVGDIIKQKVEEAKHKRQEARRQPKRARVWALVASVPLLFGLTAWNLTRAGDRPTVFTSDEVNAGVRFKIYLAAQAVEAYRRSRGRLPPNLAAVGMDGDGLTYSTVESTYTIVGHDGGLQYAYRRGDDLAPFVAGYRELTRKGAR